MQVFFALNDHDGGDDYGELPCGVTAENHLGRFAALLKAAP